ncbi:MAG: hypothetical protein Q7S58_21455 [Candidatus Binatus sp.]|uniref:hypothetical protein n=1 Tax=Candidatus Binatus sp. TaxID=2811406 RepID=UPI0027194D36|nr:hypothetical protein [Candidatus Binatus sp.]MDO8434974.1 hypothetical protein [Candidatus Binatus sp.]
MQESKGSIPQFDSANPVHRDLASAAEKAEQIASSVEIPEALHFTRARQLIRKSLKDAGLWDQIEKLAEAALR